MRVIIFLIFVLCLGIAGYLGSEIFFAKPKGLQTTLPKGSLEERIFSDLLELKSKNQLPPELNSISGFMMSDARQEKKPSIDKKLRGELRNLFALKPTGNNEIEIVIFDTTDTSEAKEKSDKRIVLQFSVLEKKTGNKVAEFGRTYSVE